MKERYTITLDPQVAQKAKLQARHQGKSFSKMVEDALNYGFTSEESSRHKPVSARWRGRATLADHEEDPRLNHLKGKYGL